MHSSSQSIVVRHKEFLGEITGSTTFSVDRTLVLQPGDKATFPWLYSIAARFQQYRVKGMVFHYVPTSGLAVTGTNPAIGSVMIQTSYRASDSPPSSKVEMLNEYWSCESAPDTAFCHPIECDPRENPFSIHYVSTTGTLPTGDSALMYNLGKTFVATSGMPATGNVVGDLWVTYEIELSKPQVTSNVSFDDEFYMATGTNPIVGSWFPTTGLTSTGTLNCYVTEERKIVWPHGNVGKFLIVVSLNAPANFTAIDLSGGVTLTDCFEASIDMSGSAYHRTVMASGGTSRAFYVAGVEITKPDVISSISFPNGTWTGTATKSTLLVTRFA